MPTYDYVCDACGHALEIFHSITEPPRKKCPECGKLKLRRLIGPGAAVIFKGSGFYQTDYRSDSYKKAAEAAEKSHAKPNGKGDSKGGEKSNSSSTAGDAK
jgi:putative FmdB family regulatory protein